MKQANSQYYINSFGIYDPSKSFLFDILKPLASSSELRWKFLDFKIKYMRRNYNNNCYLIN